MQRGGFNTILAKAAKVEIHSATYFEIQLRKYIHRYFIYSNNELKIGNMREYAAYYNQIIFLDMEIKENLEKISTKVE